jgi:hypothetical protein
MLPVDEATRKRVRTHWTLLTGLIELDSGLVHQLYAKGYISRRQREVVEGQQFRTQKTEKLLEILLRKSLDAFDALKSCLKETKQIHILKLLDGSAGNTMLVFILPLIFAFEMLGLFGIMYSRTLVSCI